MEYVKMKKKEKKTVCIPSAKIQVIYLDERLIERRSSDWDSSGKSFTTFLLEKREETAFVNMYAEARGEFISSALSGLILSYLTLV